MSDQDNIVQEGFVKKAARAIAGKFVANERAKAHHSAAMRNIVKATDPGRSPEEVGAAMRSSTRNRKAERALNRASLGDKLPKFGTRKEDIEMASDIISILESNEPHNLKEVVYTALTQKMMEALDEYKMVVARSYFGQDLAEGALKGFKAQDLDAKEKKRLEKPEKPESKASKTRKAKNKIAYQRHQAAIRNPYLGD